MGAYVGCAVVQTSEQKHNSGPCRGPAGPSRTAMPVQRPGPGSATSGPHSYAPCPGQSTAGREPAGGQKENQRIQRERVNKTITDKDKTDEWIKIIIIIKFKNQNPHSSYLL